MVKLPCSHNTPTPSPAQPSPDLLTVLSSGDVMRHSGLLHTHADMHAMFDDHVASRQELKMK